MDAAWAWRVLGVPPGSSPDACRSAFRAAAQLMHPDRVADLPDDVRAEAHRRMAELAEAYRVCGRTSAGERPRRARHDATGPLEPAGDLAADLLADALAATAPRDVVQTLEHVADGWPGTAEGDRARALLVTSEAARNALSARERARHLVLVVDESAREQAWDSLSGREELAIAQVVYAHPAVSATLRARARARLAELDDWGSLGDDDDPDVRRTARAHLLVREAAALVERATWLSRRERAAFDEDLAAWRSRADDCRAEQLDLDLRAHLDDAEQAIRAALSPARAGRA